CKIRHTLRAESSPAFLLLARLGDVSMNRFVPRAHAVAGVALLSLSLHPASLAAEAVNFQGKTISMMIGSEPGGGTDAASRLVARHIGDYLPGQPKILIRNNGSGNGVAALNYV